MNGYNNQQPVYNPQVMNQKKTPGFAIASMCCGIASVAFCCLNFVGVLGILNIACSVCGVVFGILSMKKEAPNGKGMALTGIICGGIGLFLALILWLSSCLCMGCMGAGTDFLLAEMMEELMYEFY